MRSVSVFQVADAAVSNVVFQSLMQKNRPLLSARSYAYRADLTVHDALQYLHGEFIRRDRLFIAEYDFSKYFDTIDHEHILRVLSEGGFLMTAAERRVIRAFLAAPEAELPPAYQEQGGTARVRGVPQGTSISLFLANAAAAPLDRALERLGVGFVRYADDTVIWSNEYGQLCRAVDELHSASRGIGSELNPEKSEGVRLFVAPRARAELPHTTYVDFVGYRVSLRNLGMKASAEDRVRNHIRRLLYYNLLHEPLRGTQNPARLAGRVDQDYATFIWQTRRYLYGDLSENDVRSYQVKAVPLRRFKGLMSFYPLLDDMEQLRRLDRWLATEAFLTMRKRRRLLVASGRPVPPPLGLPKQDLISYTRTSASTGGTLDLRLPSFRRIASVVRKAASVHGPSAIGRGKNPYDY